MGTFKAGTAGVATVTVYSFAASDRANVTITRANESAARFEMDSVANAEFMASFLRGALADAFTAGSVEGFKAGVLTAPEGTDR
jgi:hypothetical protein